MYVDVSHELDNLKKLLEENRFIPWSGYGIDGEHYLELLALPGERDGEYRSFVKALYYVMSDEKAYERFVGEGQFLDLLSDLLEIDNDIAAELYDLVCLPHLTGTHERQGATEAYPASRAAAPSQDGKDTKGEASPEKLEEMQDQRQAVLDDIGATGILYQVSKR